MNGPLSPQSRPTSDNTLKLQPQNDGAGQRNESGQVEGQASTVESPVNEKTTIQDQTNLLPVKQVMIVFVGLSCALFCKLGFARELHVGSPADVQPLLGALLDQTM